MDEDELKFSEACGLFGAVLSPEGQAVQGFSGITVVRGLEQLQHRLILSQSVCLIGHNRYSTAGMKDSWNCIQPFVVHTIKGSVAVAHNGQLANANQLRHQVLKRGVGLSTDTDSEIISQIIAHSVASDIENNNNQNQMDVGKQIIKLMESGTLTMSYSLLLMTSNRVIAIRDPYGNRPLSIGQIKCPDGKRLAYIVSSETCAFAAVKGEMVREVKPGEVVEFVYGDSKIISTVANVPKAFPAMCIFEYVYFARESSNMEGQDVSVVRNACGERLAIEHPVDADIVATVPDSATPAALGFARQSGIPYQPVINKNAYVGRTFIQPNDKLRQSGVLRKFEPLRQIIEGKRIVLVDDSIVRGNTMKPIVQLLRRSGAKQVHIRVASPPIMNPCYYGINIPRQTELIAANKTLEEIEEIFDADSVRYLSVEGLKEVVGRGAVNNGQQNGHTSASSGTHCTGCLSNHYPIPPTNDIEDLCSKIRL